MGMLMGIGVVTVGATISTGLAAETAVPAHCALFPLWKADCRAAISAAVKESGKVTIVASGTLAAAVADGVPDAIDHGWRCVPRTDGKAFFKCSK